MAMPNGIYDAIIRLLGGQALPPGGMTPGYNPNLPHPMSGQQLPMPQQPPDQGGGGLKGLLSNPQFMQAITQLALANSGKYGGVRAQGFQQAQAAQQEALMKQQQAEEVRRQNEIRNRQEQQRIDILSGAERQKRADQLYAQGQAQRAAEAEAAQQAAKSVSEKWKEITPVLDNMGAQATPEQREEVARVFAQGMPPQDVDQLMKMAKIYKPKPGTAQTTTLSPQTVQVDGKEVMTNYNRASGRYFDMAGNDITARVNPVPKANQDPNRILSPEELETAARMLATYEMPGSQIPGFGGAQRIKIATRAKQINPNWNYSQSEAMFKWGANPSLINRVKYIENVENTLQTAEKASEDLAKGNIQLLNKAKIATLSQTGDQRAAAMMTANTILSEELAQIFQGGTGSATSDAKLRLAQETLNASYSPAQYKKTMETLRELLKARKMALISGTWMEPTGGTVAIREATGGTNQSSPAFPGAPPIGTVVDGYEYIGGDPNKSTSWKKVG